MGAGPATAPASSGGATTGDPRLTLLAALRLANDQLDELAARNADQAEDLAEQREAFRGMAGRLATAMRDLESVHLYLAAHAGASALLERTRQTLADLAQICTTRGEL